MKTSFIEEWFAEHTSSRRVLLAFLITVVGTPWFGYLHLGLDDLVVDGGGAARRKAVANGSRVRSTRR